MQKLSLTKRPAKIGKSINTRTEMHGKEEVPAHDIPVSGLIIDHNELNLLCGCDSAYNALYMAGDGNLVVPRFSAFAPFVVLHKFIGAKVKIGTPAEDIEFSSAGLKDIVVEAKTGGHSEIHFKLQVTSKNKHLDVPGLLNAAVTISIRSAELEVKNEQQPELPMDHNAKTPEQIAAAQDDEAQALSEAGIPPDGVDPLDLADETESKIGRQIRRSEVKGRREAKRKK